MKKTLVKLTATVLTLCMLLCGCAGNTDSMLEKAAKYLSEGNYEEAIIAFQSALEIDPRRAETWADIIPAYEKAMANDYTLNYAEEIIDAYEQIEELLDGLETPEDYISLVELYLLIGDTKTAEEIMNRGRQKFGDEPFDDLLPKIIVTNETADEDVMDALTQLYNLFAANDTDGAFSFISTGMVTRELPLRNYTVDNGSGVMKCSFSCNGTGAVDGTFWFLSGSDMQTIRLSRTRHYIANAVYSGGAYNGPYSSHGTFMSNGDLSSKSGTLVDNLCDGTITVLLHGSVYTGQMYMGHTLEEQKEGSGGCIFVYDPYGGYIYTEDEDAYYLFDVWAVGIPTYPTW